MKDGGTWLRARVPARGGGAGVLLKVSELTIAFANAKTRVVPVDRMSFTVRYGEVVGLVGESGSGKTMTALGIVGLLPPGASVLGGDVWLADQNLVGMHQKSLRALRGRAVSYIPQDASAALNPLMRVETQIIEVLRHHQGLRRSTARSRAIELLASVAIPDPEARLRVYPHELSGGMRQRVCIAIGVACDPILIIADEPTTALDVSVQAQILELLLGVAREREAAVLLISHDLRMVASATDRVIVMYAGRAAEKGGTEMVMKQPRHPYTKGLLLSTPRMTGKRPERLLAIGGSVPNLRSLPAGCRFHPRCSYKTAQCVTEEPPVLAETGAACWHPLAEEGAEVPGAMSQ